MVPSSWLVPKMTGTRLCLPARMRCKGVPMLPSQAPSTAGAKVTTGASGGSGGPSPRSPPGPLLWCITASVPSARMHASCALALLPCCVQPSDSAKAAPVRTAASRGTNICGMPQSPLSMIAAAKRPAEALLERWKHTDIPPADSPNNVTLEGSPPKAPMLRCTH